MFLLDFIDKQVSALLSALKVRGQLYKYCIWCMLASAHSETWVECSPEQCSMMNLRSPADHRQ